MTETMTAAPASAPAGYSRLHKRLHWAAAILIAAQFLIFDAMGRPLHQMLETGVMPWTTTTIGHVCVGLGIGAFAIWRIALRLRRGAPPPPAEEPALARIAAKVAHVALYALMLGLPISGSIAWFGASHDVAEAHEAATTVLLALIALHAAAVAVHQFWWRTGLLRRMT